MKHFFGIKGGGLTGNGFTFSPSNFLRGGQCQIRAKGRKETLQGFNSHKSQDIFS